MAFDAPALAIDAQPRTGGAPASLPPLPRDRADPRERPPSFDEMFDAVILGLITGRPAG